MPVADQSPGSAAGFVAASPHDVIYLAQANDKVFNSSIVVRVEDLSANGAGKVVGLQALDGFADAFGAAGCNDDEAGERLQGGEGHCKANPGRAAYDDDGFVL